MSTFSALAGAGLLLLSSCAAPVTVPPTPASWPFRLDSGKVVARHGIIASDAPLATEAGVTILRRGGNAIDAAITTAFTLAVVMPEAGNIGGGGFIVARMADGTTAALDFREKAPSAATRDMYLDSTGNMTDLSVTGHLAAGVPGSVAGLWEAHRRFGSIPWSELLAPAITLAEEGFVVDERLAESVRDDSSRLAHFPASAALLLPEGQPLAIGSRWRNPDLARTLRRISALGPAGFYEGETATLIVDEMKRGGGLITIDDLAAYHAAWRTPVEFDYRGYRVISMPPPSSGGVTLAMIAGIARQFDLPGLAWHSAEHIHLVAEAMRRAFADRNHYLGDPDFVEIPVRTLVSDTYGAQRAKEIDLTRATPSSKVAHGPGIQEAMHTTHFSVADSAGNVVAMTTTINLGFGSAVTVTGGGFLLNNEMDDFAGKPGSPNVFGLVQGEANAIQPGKRVLSSMTPTLILDPGGKPLLVTGAAGGPRIITSVFQILSNVADFGMDIDAAVAAPRFHHQHLPDHILIERGGYDEDVRRELETMGHTIGDVRGLAVSPSLLRKGTAWHGRSDPRIQGGAAGF